MSMDRFVIEMIAISLYKEKLGKKLGLNPHSEYGRKKINEYLEKERKSDELSAKLRLKNRNPKKFISLSEIRSEAKKIEKERLKPYVEEATRIHKAREEQKKKENKTVEAEFTKEETMKQLKEIRTQLAIQHDDLLDQYCELKEKLKVKSTAETRTKRIEDKVSMKIELEKLNNRIKLLSRLVDAYDTKISLGDYNVATPLTGLAISTIETNNKELLTLLNKEYEKLDILSTKMVLSSNFRRERLKGINKYDFGPFPFAGGLFSSLFIGIPFQQYANIPFSVSNLLLGLGIPFVAGAGATTYGVIKTTNQKKEAFINLNNSLGEDKLDDEISLDYDTYKESIEINNLIDSKIQEIMIILMNQKENEMILENSKKTSEELELNNEYIRDFTNVEKTIYTGLGTVIANSGRWAGYEDIPSDYPSKILVEGSCRTERDDTMEMGVLYRHLEDDDETEISQEQSGPVLTKKLTPPKDK